MNSGSHDTILKMLHVSNVIPGIVTKGYLKRPLVFSKSELHSLLTYTLLYIALISPRSFDCTSIAKGHKPVLSLTPF